MASGRDDFPREITSVYSSESVGRGKQPMFSFFNDPKQYKEAVGVALRLVFNLGHDDLDF
jgi:hypothetical protein